jgi:predicted GIY-YIG superfamily endonuclease
MCLLPEGRVRTALYRFFNADGALLYVGITHRLNERLSAHKKQKAWDEVAQITLQHYPTRELAADAEVKAIQTENPHWNVTHSAGEHYVARISPDVWKGDEESRTRYLRFRAWPDLGKFYSDRCTKCLRWSDDELEPGTMTELVAQEFGFTRRFSRGPVDGVNAGSILLEYECPRCGHIWECFFGEDLPLWQGADPSVLSWLLSLFPRGSVWDKEDVWMLV